MEKTELSVAHSMGFFNEERPCGRGEELTLFVVKNALGGLLYDTPTQGAKRRTRMARRVV